MRALVDKATTMIRSAALLYRELAISAFSLILRRAAR